VSKFHPGQSVRILSAEEIADVQLACETALSGLGFHEKERRNIRLANIQKNTKRGYYNV
jgi:hypothetical protein